MAEEIKINLQADFEQAQKNYASAKGGLSAKEQSKAENTIAQIKALGNLNSLSSKNLTQLSHLVNDLTKYINKGITELSSVSKEFKAASEKLQTLQANRANLGEARQKAANVRKSALQNIKTDKYTFTDTKTGRAVRNPETIIARGSDRLQVTNAQGAVISGAALDSAYKSTGLTNFARADQAYKTIDAEYKTASEAVKAQQAVVDTLEVSGGISVEAQNIITQGSQFNTDIDSTRNVATESTNQETSRLGETMDLVNPQLEKHNSYLGQALKQYSIWAVATRTIKSALKETSSTIQELDQSLTEQAMVTGKTREETYNLLTTYQDLASELGTTTKEVASVATEYMRQGKTTQESLTLTEAAISAAKVAGISASESINYLTTALNGFQLSADDAMTVSDKFAAVAATSATNYEELAVALSKVASQANLAGMSIDYTTALLAKGIETTREAPETIGTALKTIIARMREISDYGETLDGSTDVNNVETQLAYVGIALKDTNGELRSTEDVLDELGRKWDTLNSNQQAAVAKALAGTRQQSRLIAMMTDYERVIELQEVATRSSGATLAQMKTYMEGMSAALNKITVAWEKITTSLANSEVIINIVNWAGQVLDNVASILENEGAQIAVITAIATLSAVVASHKIQEWMYSKMILAIQGSQRVQEAKSVALEAQETLEKQKQSLSVQEQLRDSLKLTKQTLLRKKAEQGLSAQEELTLANLDSEIAQTEANIAQNKIQVALAETQVNQATAQVTQLQSQNSFLEQIRTSITGFIPVLGIITSSVKLLNALKEKGITLSKTQNVEDKKGVVISGEKATAETASAAAKSMLLPVAIGLLAVLGITASAIALSQNYNSSLENTANEVEEITSNIYKLSSTNQSLSSTIASFESIDKQIIKTNDDLEEMNSLLEEASDQLTDEQKETYNNLTTNAQKINYLKALKQSNAQSINEYQQTVMAKIASASAADRSEMLNVGTTDSEALTMQSAIYAVSNQWLYNYIDTLDDAADGVESLTQSILEGLSPTEAYWYAQDPKRVGKLVDAINKLTVSYTDVNGAMQTGGVAEILTSDSSSFTAKVAAYREALTTLTGSALTSFKELYSDIDTLSEWSDSLLAWVDSVGATADGINTLAKAIQKVGATVEESEQKIQDLFTMVQSGTSVRTAIESLFGNLDAEDYNRILSAYESAIGTGMLNIGQNITKIKNTVTSFYEKASDWNSLTDTEKTEFISDNSELFTGADSAALMKALENADYDAIQKILQNNETLKNNIQDQIEEIEREIEIEESRLEEDQDQGYINYLKQQKEYLEDVNQIYAASLDDRLQQEEDQLDVYKNYLQKQKDALTDSLNDRKDAYQDYFDAINDEADAEDYEEDAQTYIANLSKLAASTDASSRSQTKELEQKLEDLEEDRLDTLRQNAQDQVISNIEDEIDSIDDKFDDLLETDSNILAALTSDLNIGGSNFLTSMLATNMSGMTALEAEDYLKNTWTATFGSKLDTDQISVEKSSSGDLILNVAGQTINLSSDDSTELANEIYNALRKLGISI